MGGVWRVCLPPTVSICLQALGAFYSLTSVLAPNVYDCSTSKLFCVVK